MLTVRSEIGSYLSKLNPLALVDANGSHESTGEKEKRNGERRGYSQGKGSKTDSILKTSKKATKSRRIKKGIFRPRCRREREPSNHTLPSKAIGVVKRVRG
jgi:hypothetical protein